PHEKQDLTLADLNAREGRALVIAVSIWDLVKDRAARLKELREDAARRLPQLKGTADVPVSGATGEGIEAMMAAVFAVHETWNKRISTGRLNRWLATALEANPPPAVSGRRIKIRYITQPRARPPYFIVFGNQLASLPESYKRFLINGIRETFDLKGVPIRLSTRTNENPYESKGRK
ncbi:MAG: ribosome biogenesis GTPase Der, partial [Methylovirgula sp.]|nr:ribosome biogenesis GTPase Der [Methylovirgula sp.]